MKKLLILIGAATTIFFLSACGSTDSNDSTASKKEIVTEDTNKNTETQQEGEITLYPQLSKEVASNEALVTMNTSMGSIKIKLFPEQAPKTVENFLTHAENGYYDGMIFHRVIQDFMIQGGDPTGTGMGGESIYGAEFEDEFSVNLFNLRGALSMANAGPNTNGSQFFIVQASEPPATAQQMIDGGWPKEIAEAYAEMGGTPHLDQKHTVFGQVIEGLDIVDQIAAVEKGANDKPVVDITIDSIEIVQK
ncbi:peptidylprolyl isomerase [Psychrobacillus antarcticus]|uniref:peptidylprolyl isomerase n=1 Tax=Psychrobacillus antarcticus TaxID=2879115 RepID=UPI002407A249|nr:peptidylprolyl isomerase [Psychrobacillus antarcticus]